MSVYKNGNTIVEIREDGTKIRFVPDDEPALPVYPESIDLKITNYCSMGCPMCHEQSTSAGKPGNLNSKLVDSFHPYTEVAIGGGDPLSHKNLPDFLRKLKEKKVIANLTVHWQSFVANLPRLIEWQKQDLFHGLGISIEKTVPDNVIEKIKKFPNAVIHTVIGIADENVYKQLANNELNILLLGYKTLGRGVKYKEDNPLQIDVNTEWVKNNIRNLPMHFKAVCFDNLAIKQTKLKEILDPEKYKQIYMGGDGTFTMYVDLVENKYAISSTSERHDIFSNNIDDLFASVREMAKE